MTLQGSHFRSILLVLSLAWGAATAYGQPSGAPDRDAQRVVAALPAQADAVVIINNAAAQRLTPAGRQLTSLLEEAGSLTASRKAWAKLAATLGCTSAQAFDDLLGRQVVLVMRGLNRADGPDWAVFTHVTAATERRLRDRLAAVPRGHVAGLSVLGVEDGAYQLVIGRKGGGGDSRTASSATMLLGPRGGDLFDEMAPSVLSTAHSRLVAAAGQADVLAVLRSSQGDSGRTIAITALRSGDGWSARIVASPPSREMLEVQPWSRSIFDRLQEDSLAGIMGVGRSLNAAQWQESAAGSGLLRMLPLNTLAFSLPEQDSGLRAGFFVQRAQVRGRTKLAPTGASSVQAARVLVPNPRTSSSWSLLWAVEMRDPQKMMFQGDQLVAGLVASLRDEDGWLKLEVPAAEQESRVLPLGEVLPPHSHLAALHELFGPAAVFRWGFSRPADPYELLPPAQSRSGEDHWWLAALEPAESRSAELARLALTSGSSGQRSATDDMRPWLTLGTIRPAQLLKSGAAAGELLAPMRPLRRVDSLEWEAWVREDGMIEGAIRLRMER